MVIYLCLGHYDDLYPRAPTPMHNLLIKVYHMGWNSEILAKLW